MAARSITLPVVAGGAVAVAVLMQHERVAPIGNALAAAIFFILWWVLLFAVLPIGVRTQHDAGEVIHGTAASAPIAPRLGRVALLTTIVASTAFALALVAIRVGWVPLRQ